MTASRPEPRLRADAFPAARQHLTRALIRHHPASLRSDAARPCCAAGSLLRDAWCTFCEHDAGALRYQDVGKALARPSGMPTTSVKKKAEQDRAEGKSGSTQAGEFVREEMHHIREGKHGARNAKQAIAIGLSKARRAGVEAEPGPSASPRTRRKAAQDSARAGRRPSARRARASSEASKREPRAAASHQALSRQAKASAEKRRKAGGSNSPSAAAKRGAKTRKRRTASARAA